MDGKLETWPDLQKAITFTGILLGNGASLAVWPHFAYESLFEVAKGKNAKVKLTASDVSLFDSFSTRNFERVLAALATARKVAEVLQLATGAPNTCYSRIQMALGEAVKGTHIPWTSVEDDTLQAIRTELLRYKFVFSTNYDLLLYWAVMHQGQGGFKDYFWSDTFDLADVAIWGDPSRVFYLHGGLHLCRSSGRTKKPKGSETHNLLEQFGGALDVTPLFVTEGTAEDKMAAIAGSDYLTFAYSNLVGLKGPLCIFGHSLGELDQHIVSAISRSEISTLAVSVWAESELKAKEFKAHVTKVLPSKKLRFFDAKTHPLGADELLAYGGGA